MFAFCPMVSHQSCGVIDSNFGGSTDMNLIANSNIKVVQSKGMKYREGRPNYRQYDACFYQINSKQDSENLEVPKKVHF